METKLTRIAEIAKEQPNERITGLAYLINKESITESHRQMKTGKATGVDEITKEEYEKKQTENIDLLIDRMKKQAYKPQPVRRTYIPKTGTDKMRPLGIPAYEDKLVQNVLNKILNRKADAVACAESNIVTIAMVRMSQLPRGRRARHVIHRYDTITRETLFALQT